LLRLIVAVIFIYAGWAKFSFWSAAPAGIPAVMVIIFKLLLIVEPLGGVALIAGYLTRWAAAGLTIIMVGAILIMQFMMQTGFATPQGVGWNFPLAVLGCCIVLMVFGAGDWSADMMRKKA